LDVTYESSNLAVATVSGNTVTIVGAGETVITASQAGNLNYNAAPEVPQTLAVTQAQSQTKFASWSGSPNTLVTSDLVYKYAFGAANPNSEAQKMTSSVSATPLTLSLTAVVRTDDDKLRITAISKSSLSGSWATSDKAVSESVAGDQMLNGVPLATGLVRKVYTVDRTGDPKRFLRLNAEYTP